MSQATRLVVLLILARLLVPSEFGVASIVIAPKITISPVESHSIGEILPNFHFDTASAITAARRTARDVASPAAQLLREPVFGACRYVRRLCPSTHASDTALITSSRDSPSICATTAVVAILTSTT